MKRVDHSKQGSDRICSQRGSLLGPGIFVLSRDQTVFVCFNGYFVENVFGGKEIFSETLAVVQVIVACARVIARNIKISPKMRNIPWEQN